jgi:Tfp pilus assembly protein PilN
MSLVPIPGTSLVRDTTTMALVNQDKNGLDDYLKKRNILASQKQEINNMKSDVQSLKQDMKEIKQMLLQLMDKNLNG